jgi:GTP-binding protein
VKIRSVEFAGSLADPGGPVPEGLPQIAFSGRSNVGKSSLINTLLRRTRKKIAHVSSTPGKTQTINFFRVNERFYLVDLPGFGFARVPKAVRRSWKELIESYLSSEPQLRGVVHLVDSRRPPADVDHSMLEYLAGLQVPVLVILTKIDKVKASKRQGIVQRAASSLGLDAEQVLPFSSVTGEGREDLLDSIEAVLAS